MQGVTQDATNCYKWIFPGYFIGYWLGLKAHPGMGAPILNNKKRTQDRMALLSLRAGPLIGCHICGEGKKGLEERHKKGSVLCNEHL